MHIISTMNPTRISTIFVLSCISQTLIGSEHSQPVPIKEQISPRTLGSAWIYNSGYWEDDVWYNNGTSLEHVVNEQEFEGVNATQIKLTFESRTLSMFLAGLPLEEDSNSYFWEYATPAGSYHYGSEEGTADERPEKLEDFGLTLPQGKDVGYTYEDEGDSWEIIESNKDVTVPAGTFTCTVYQSTDTSDPDYIFRSRFFMAKGTGLIIYETDVQIDNAWIPESREELVWYNINP